MINEELLSKTIDLIEVYKKEENIIFNKMNELFKMINNDYITNNTDKLNNIEFELSNKFNIILNIHTNDINILKNTLNNYCTNKQTVKNIFNNMI